MTLLTIFYFLMPFTSMSGTDQHEFHISVCDIKYVESSRSVQISQRIFLDDLEKALILFANDASIDVIHPKDPKKLDSLVINYAKAHFNIIINQKATIVQFLGSEVKDDVMVVYAEVISIKSLKNIKITNDLLTDLYPDQMNIVHIQYLTKTKSIRLSKSQISDSVLFE